jgi:hypothetical protein
MPRPSLVLRRAATAVVAAGVASLLAGCRDDGGSGDTAQFCEMVQENVEALRANPQTPEEIEQLIDLYIDVGAVAPLAIEPDWSALTLNLETAWTGEDTEEIYARIYATERSAVAVATWLADNCAVDWGPVSTIVPDVTTTLPATTAPPG